MKIDLSQTLHSLKKEPLKDEKDEFVTLKKLCVTALATENEESSKESGEEKVKRFKLFMRLDDVKDFAELSAEEITLIKSKMAKLYSALAVGQCYAMLEGETSTAA